MSTQQEAPEMDLKELKKQTREQLKQIRDREKDELKNRKVQKKKQKEEKRIKEGKTKTTEAVRKSILDIIPIRSYKNNRFILDDGSFLDIYQVRGQSFLRASEEEIQQRVAAYTLFYRRMDESIKFLALNYPTNTKKQQKFLQDKLKNSTFEVYHEMIESKLRTLQYLEECRTDREVFLFFWAKDDADYLSQKNKLFAGGALNLQELSYDKKCNILFQLNNPNQKIKV